MITQRGADVSGLAERERLERQWAEVRQRFLPAESPHSIWCFDAALRGGLPRQGWKLHVSATVLTAADTLVRVAPVLAAFQAHYKAPRTLTDLAELNAGLTGDYSQVGKFLTVYPTRDVVALATALDRATAELAGPAVPFEPRLRPNSRVSYRYGVIHTEGDDDPTVLRLPDGSTCADTREPDTAVPAWAPNPFDLDRAVADEPATARADTMTTHPFYAYEAIQQRGKGGTYRALDVGNAPARRCILKEGRRHGEVDWCGLDGYDRVHAEAAVLRRLRAAGAPVPEVLGSIELPTHVYVVLSELAGTDLQTRILTTDTPPMRYRYRLCRDICAVLACIHATGLAWRDCKPANLVVGDDDGAVAAIDFEGACDDQDERTSGFGTRLYLPWNWMSRGRGWQCKDLFSLGITLAQVLTWRFDPDAARPGAVAADASGAANRRATLDRAPSPAETVDRYRSALAAAGVAPVVCGAIDALWDRDEAARPAAHAVTATFAAVATGR